MRLVSRNDVFLLGGLAIALFVLFSGPLGRVLDMAREIDRSRGLQLLPALVILGAVFIFHQQRKRLESHAETADMGRMTMVLAALAIRNEELLCEVRENSVRDGLTGCVNRKHATDVMDAELRRARRSKLPLTLLMFDLDHFKGINDRYGHLCGDAVLATVGQRMNAVLRGSDLKCRYGGEEFLVLLPDTPIAGAQRVAETLRRELETHPVTWNGETVRVTASFGLATVLPGEVDATTVIGRADAALYDAKQGGRNCVRVAEPHEAIV